MAITIEDQGSSYVEWSAVIAGSVFACAISLVLVQFGNALGLSVSRFQYDEKITAARVFTVGLWLLWVQLMASICGSYLAGRMRTPWKDSQSHESELRDGAHGLLVWATSSLIAVTAASLAAFLTAVIAQQGFHPVTDVHVSADTLRKSGLILGFGLAGSSVVSAVAAWGMGILGGDHRDAGVDASKHVSFRKKINRVS